MLYVCLLVISEIGDKSQLTTFVISVNYNWKCILLGGGAAHIFTTMLAICTSGNACADTTTNIMESLMYLIVAISEILFGIAFNPQFN